jgi:hypothetical protein
MNRTNEIQNQETRVDTNVQEEKPATEEQPQNGETPEVKNTEKANWAKQAVIGGGGAIAGAAGAAAIMGFVVPDDAPETEAKPESHAGSHSQPVDASLSAAAFDGSQTPAASHVNDSMSFAEAFASARQETGQGGIFFWRGGVYGTYYRDEWNQLSPEYRQAFSNYPYPRPEDAAAGDSATAGSATAAAAEPTAANLQTGDTATEQTATAGSNDPAPEQLPADAAAATSANDPGNADTAGDVEILDVQYVNAGGQTATVAPANTDGSEGLPVDAGTDGVFDYVPADSETPEAETLGIPEYLIAHEDAAGTDDSYLADNNLPDYTNNASIENFVNT